MRLRRMKAWVPSGNIKRHRKDITIDELLLHIDLLDEYPEDTTVGYAATVAGSTTPILIVPVLHQRRLTSCTAASLQYPLSGSSGSPKSK